jgi:hypothetical protein
MPSYPLVNGTRYDWSSAGFKMGGADEYGFKEISYTDTIDRGEVRGVGPQVIGHTRGEYKAEGSFVMLKEEFDAWVAKTGDGWMETIAKVETNPSNGTDPLEVSCDLTVTYIIRNGKKPLANMRT